jgi:hypothetical protein
MTKRKSNPMPTVDAVQDEPRPEAAAAPRNVIVIKGGKAKEVRK